MYSVSLTENEIKLIRWSIQVAGDTLAMQEENHITAEEVLGFMSELDTLDKSLVSQVKPQREDILGAPDRQRFAQIKLSI